MLSLDFNADGCVCVCMCVIFLTTFHEKGIILKKKIKICLPVGVYEIMRSDVGADAYLWDMLT